MTLYDAFISYSHAKDKPIAAVQQSLVQWQRDPSISHANLATVYLKLGDVAQALPELHKGREIMAKLVAIDPQNDGWETDLAWFDTRIAEIEAGSRERKG